ncbi:MAG: GDP-fucose synthetase [Flavobacteriaceae bacterium]|nr:GDP-fucose synthetase [Flavobacteriaceae bacterium]
MQLNKKSKIFIAGHNGMVGSSVLRHFKKKGYKNLFFKNRKSLNLIDQKKTYSYINKIKPDFVIIGAAKVGGIFANNYQKAKFIYENIMIQTNLIHSSFLVGVKKLIFLGSSCIYPKYVKQPIREDYLMTGKLEETNDSYAVAKLAGYKMCEAYNKQYKTNYICLMPTNLYGVNDNYDRKTSHFFPAIISKTHLALKKKSKTIKIWGDGSPKRELMYVDDLADACEFFLKKKIKHSLINIGSGEEKTILSYYKFVIKKLNANLKIIFDKNKPNGTPRKKLDLSLAKNYGWRSKYNLNKGFDLTYKDYLKKIDVNK